MKRLFGLIGKKLGHSFSKTYFTEKFQKENLKDYEYHLFELSDIHEFPGLVKANPSLAGLNVTIPYKQEIMPFLNEIDGAAAQISAVNTISISNGKLKGYNTDAPGFKRSLLETPNINTIKGALVLGNGGAAQAVKFCLAQLGIPFKCVSRSLALDCIPYDENELKILLGSHNLLINTTPLGMYPDTEKRPLIPYSEITKNHILFDLVYNPELTAFLKEGQSRGAVVKNGLDMLHYQAEYAWQVWNENTL